MDPTPAQKAKVRYLKDVFGGAVQRVSTRLQADGCVHVYLLSAAGEWDWAFDADGELHSAHLATRLFDAPASVLVRRARPDDEISATQKPGGDNAATS